MTIYFFIYFAVTFFVKDGNNVIYLITSYNVINAIFTFTGLMLYFYTIMMLRNAIAECASFHFETKGTYVICALYCFLLVVQIFYLLAYEFFD